MIRKIIKITVGQIIMWVAVWLADIIQTFSNDFIGFVCFFIAPVCLLVKYALTWMSVHSCDKKDRLLKWIVQYVIFLGIWWLETYVIGITPDRGFLAGIKYGWWAMLAVILVTIAVIMHILCTVIKRFSKYEIIHKVINVLLGIGMVVFIFWGEADAKRGWDFFAVAILAGFACFFFNWCYYKVQ